MSTDVLNQIKQLPPDKQEQVVDFITYLINKYVPRSSSDSKLAEQRRSKLGRLKGKIRISDDFNETPEDFNDYL